MLGGVSICQAIAQQAIDKSGIAIFAAGSESGEIMGDVGHGFGTTSYDCRGVTSHDGLCGEDDGFEGGGADFVYGGADSGVWHASFDGTLAGRILAEAGCDQHGIFVEKKLTGLTNFAERTLPK